MSFVRNTEHKATQSRLYFTFKLARVPLQFPHVFKCIGKVQNEPYVCDCVASSFIVTSFDFTHNLDTVSSRCIYLTRLWLDTQLSTNFYTIFSTTGFRESTHFCINLMFICSEMLVYLTKRKRKGNR